MGREGKREERVSDETTETKRGVKVMFDEIREREREIEGGKIERTLGFSGETAQDCLGEKCSSSKGQTRLERLARTKGKSELTLAISLNLIA